MSAWATRVARAVALPLAVAACAGGGGERPAATAAELAAMPWDSVEARARGTTVTWVNCDTPTHTATSDVDVWDSGALTPGATFQRTFNTAGAFPFHCTPHPTMKGTVVVS